MPTVVTNPKLEAVNIMLSVIGEAPVNSLTSGLADAEAAEKILNRINREVQTEGWHFNTRRKYALTPDAISNKVTLPSNTLKVTPVDVSRDYPLTQRGLKLYDYEKHTYEIGANYTEVKVDLVEELDYNDDDNQENSLPEYARRYIAVRAARVFVSRYLGAQEIYGFSQIDEAMARAELKQADGLISKRSIFDHHTRGEFNLYEAYNRFI